MRERQTELGLTLNHDYAELLVRRRAKFREQLDAIVLTFNRYGIVNALNLLRKHHLLDPDNPASVASFIFFVPGLDKAEVHSIGHFFGVLI